jgi:iron complex outermembrane receptor protein
MTIQIELGRGMKICFVRQELRRRALNFMGGSMSSKTRFSSAILQTTSLIALSVAMQVVGANSAAAQQAGQTSEAITEEVVVTGTRIVREGYQAPTPLTVISEDALSRSASGNLGDYINTMPALTASNVPTSLARGVTSGNSGVNQINLRNLGVQRTLVLLDGQRSVGATFDGAVDINTFPQALITRVDVVTGGASAVYGSDAVAGVVNFVLDREYTGVKGEVSGGMTNYGDAENYKIDLSGGFAFGGGRGHVLLNGQLVENKGIPRGSNGRAWNLEGWSIMTNPLYGTGAGQTRTVPQNLFLNQLGLSNSTPGGIVTTGPLKGTAFGPGGSIYQFQYGSLTFDPFTYGGDWASTLLQPTRGNGLDPEMAMRNLFTRVSYDLTDNVQVYAQVSWAYSHTKMQVGTNWRIGNVPLIKADNAFIPASVRTRMLAAGVTTLQMGSMNADLPSIGADNERTVNRNVIGANGSFSAFNTDWKWDAYFQNGISRGAIRTWGMISNAKYVQAVDAVTDAQGRVVCRDPSGGCVPFNVFGTGVNNEQAVNWLIGRFEDGRVIGDYPRVDTRYTQNVFSGTLSGEPIDVPAGPVSVALNVEHRSEKATGVADATGLANGWFFSNFNPTVGSYRVTEGAFETVIPLFKDQSFARSWDVNGAVRLTDYSTSGSVVTWKVGTVYAPIDDIKFRVTQSRDIRAPSLSDLFAPGVATGGFTITDPVVNANYQTRRGPGGNVNLAPEKADTTSVGAVFQPTFAPGLSASVDWWSIRMKDAITILGHQQIVDICAAQSLFCNAIDRGPDNRVTLIRTIPFNLARLKVKGIDFEVSYRTPMSDIYAPLPGNISLHANMTRYLTHYQSSSITVPIESVGANAVNSAAGAGSIPKWRLTTTLAWEGENLTASLTGRALSSGTYGNQYIECTTACPISTPIAPTINLNRMPSAFYLDAAVSYRFLVGDDIRTEVFFNARNITNKSPPPAPSPSTFMQSPSINPTMYDVLGTILRAGVRFKM